MAATGYPRSTLYPGAALYPTGGAAGTPNEHRYPSTTRYPTAGPALPQILSPRGIDSGERHGGIPTLPGFLPAESVFPSDNAVGRLRIVVGAVSILPGGVSTAALFGVSQINRVLAAFGVSGAEAFGSATFRPGQAAVAAASSVTTGEQFGEQFVRRSTDRFIVAQGIASRETFGEPAPTPSVTLYPSTHLYPARGTGIAGSISVGAAHLGETGIPSGAQFGLATLVSYAYIPPPASGAVGHPRRGLRPGAGKQPGHLHAGSSDDSPLLYARIKYPSGSIFPGRGLYPARTDLAPIHRRGVATAVGRARFTLSRDNHFRRFVATFLSAGKLSAHGVFSSGPSDMVTAVVEYSDGVYPVEMNDGRAALDYEDVNLELDSE